MKGMNYLTKECEVCGKEFKTNLRTRRACYNPRCLNEVWRRRQAQRKGHKTPHTGVTWHREPSAPCAHNLHEQCNKKENSGARIICTCPCHKTQTGTRNHYHRGVLSITALDEEKQREITNRAVAAEAAKWGK